MVKTNYKPKCKNCLRNFNTLTDENLCYCCYMAKYGKHPTSGVYRIIEKK